MNQAQNFEETEKVVAAEKSEPKASISLWNNLKQGLTKKDGKHI